MIDVFQYTLYFACPVNWGCRIHRLLLCRGVRPCNKSPGYNTKRSDGVVPVMLELWEMQSTPFIAIAPRSSVTGSDST